MEEATKHRNIKLLPLICLAIFSGHLLAGLWPFQFWTANNVHWIDGQPGLRFDQYGIVTGRDPVFTMGGPIDFAKPFTLLLEIRPREEPFDSIPRILSAYNAGGRELFILGQWKSGLIIRILEEERYFYLRYRETGIGNIRKDAIRSIAIRSDIDRLSIYVDGISLITSPGVDFSLLKEYHSPAWLILGNSPTGKSPWRGDLLTLSIYPRALSPGEIESPGIDPVLRYRFSEGSGSVCRGGGDPRYDLDILPVFRAPAKAVLEPPWRIQQYNRSFWKDVSVNILGFIPFGFAMNGWIWMRKNGECKGPSAILLVVLLGAGISLFIELLQVYLPTRDTSLIDFINNIMGTYIGALSYRKAHRIQLS